MRATDWLLYRVASEIREVQPHGRRRNDGWGRRPIVARMASSTLRTTRGALVSSRFVARLGSVSGRRISDEG
jgi:hypothetical protein